MTARREEFADGKILAPASEVDFALVLSRVITSAEEDPSQLRNIVYELARIKLQEEMSRRSLSSNSPSTRDLSVALESAIERVETIHSKHDSLEAIQSLHRLADISEIKAQAPGGMVNYEAVRVYKAPLPSFLTRETRLRGTLDQHGFRVPRSYSGEPWSPVSQSLCASCWIISSGFLEAALRKRSRL